MVNFSGISFQVKEVEYHLQYEHHGEEKSGQGSLRQLIEQCDTPLEYGAGLNEIQSECYISSGM